MDRDTTQDDQRSVTFDLAVELEERQSVETSRLSEPPRPGDTFLSRHTADFPVEWLVVDATEDGRVQVVPLDDHPLVGSRDLELPESSLGGAGVLRCDLDAWLDASELDPELRTGRLRASEVEAVRRKRRTIDKDALEASLLEEEVDGDPEYRRWRADTLRPALASLTEEAKPGEPPESDSSELVTTLTGRGQSRWQILVAAAVLTAIVVPIAWQLHRVGRQLSTERTRIAELKQERRELEERLAAAGADRENLASEVERLEAGLRQAREASKRALAEQEARLGARLRRALDSSVVVNVPSFVLAKLARTRAAGGEAEVINPGGARRLTLTLEVVDPAPYRRYRLRVVNKAGGDALWQTDELVKIGGRWLRLDLPAEFFEAGEYELLIDGLGLGPPQLLAESYTVKFER